MAANLNPLNKLASSILNSFLSNYFESFQNKVVNFSLGGDIELTELEVKKDVLDGLRLPIQIKFGSLGRLKCSGTCGYYIPFFLSVTNNGKYCICSGCGNCNNYLKK